MPPLESDSTPQLSSVHALISYSWHAMRARLDLVYLLLAPTLVSLLLAVAIEQIVTEPAVVIGLTILLFVIALIQILILFIVFYIVTLEGTLTYKEALRFLKRDAIPLSLVFLLVGLAVFGGLVLFVIPGMVVMFMLYFSQYAYVIDGKRGMDALMHSRSLVKGRLGQIFLKMFGLLLYMLGAILVLMAVLVLIFGSDIVATELSNQTYATIEGFIAGLIFAVLQVVLNVMGLFIVAKLYRDLRAARPEVVAASKKVRAWYWSLVGLGVLALLALVIALGFFGQKLMTNPDLLQIPQSNSQLYLVPGSATTYAFSHNGSFEGVCDELRTVVMNEGVTCNDSETAWALSVEEGGERWCLDSNTVPKRLETPLDERTECLLLP